ncbi:MAG TPA: ankyrin repeat domain-containing protein [Vicinamibacterales bacterium]|nr:ankyrin repeat domain-containing protein [Vicinamibacterales bacterium]
MRLTSSGLLFLAVATFASGDSGGTSAQTPERIDFARDIQPLLRANCYGCHGVALQNGNLRLDRRRDSMPNRVGANGARIVPGDSASSRLYIRVSGNQAGPQMPPTGALRPEEIDAIRAWIDQGADWPDELAGEAPSPARDPIATELLDALRRGDRRRIDQLLNANPGAARATGSGGITSLMYAGLYGSAASARKLLDLGADPNARNDAGATALMWAVDDLETTRLLLDRGADPNLRSADGRTALVLAAARPGGSDVVKALLDRGARLGGEPVLSQAGDAGDAATIRLLLERGAATAPLPGDLAMRSGCADCVEMLMKVAAPAALTRALESAARYGSSSSMQLLLARGAGPTPAVLRAAAASEALPAEGVTMLLEKGVRDEQALGWAIRHGDTAVVAALRNAGVRDVVLPAPTLARPAAPRSVRDAITVSLPLLQHADTVFLTKAGCISCHNNSLFQMTSASARRKGFRIDESAIREQMVRSRAYLESWRERTLQDIPIPGRVDTTSYILAGLAAADFAPDAATDALARYLKRRQFADGGWRVATQRPPIESSDIEVTALSLRALRVYAPPPFKAEYERAVQRASAWLVKSQPAKNEDRVYLLLGLGWAGANRTVLRQAASALIAQQRDDGGWGQIPTLASDAYATGQALTALAETGMVTPSDPVYERGVRFLLGSQLQDGSWYVRTRAIPVQPYFDSEFPHGQDQFISAAATNWATMALMFAADAARASGGRGR